MTKFILDTDHITLYRHGHPILTKQVDGTPDYQLAVTIISFEEQMRGWLAQIRRKQKNDAALTLAYMNLRETIEYFCQMNMLDFDIAAVTKFRQLRQQRIRIGTQDLRIAAIALVNDCVLVTRNEQDFRQVPGLMTENWL
jgi:tRNA(fMet)-specific endonuclease VapC